MHVVDNLEAKTRDRNAERQSDRRKERTDERKVWSQKEGSTESLLNQIKATSAGGNERILHGPHCNPCMRAVRALWAFFYPEGEGGE
jgi:hypothetical protein